MHKSRFGVSISKSFRSCENSFSWFMNSYDTRGSSPLLLPMPRDIHDYIDDVLEITEHDIPIMYYYPSYYSE